MAEGMGAMGALTAIKALHTPHMTGSGIIECVVCMGSTWPCLSWQYADDAGAPDPLGVSGQENT